VDVPDDDLYCAAVHAERFESLRKYGVSFTNMQVGDRFGVNTPCPADVHLRKWSSHSTVTVKRMTMPNPVWRNAKASAPNQGVALHNVNYV
jgi:hypothetical protein